MEFILDHDRIASMLHASGLNMESSKNFITREEQFQEKKLETLHHQFLHIPSTTKSDPLTLPSDTMLIQIFNSTYGNKCKIKFTSNISEKLENNHNNDTLSSSSLDSSTDSFDSENDMTNKLYQLLKINTKNKSKTTSGGLSKQNFEKKAISLATKVIKYASQVNFQRLKLDNNLNVFHRRLN